MVNTFIIDSDIETSFKKLNWQRLGKQRVEAFQILNVLIDAIFISRNLGWELQPQGITIEDDIKREKWFNETFTKYKNYVKVHGCLTRSDNRIIKAGWSSHPAVLMWIGYEEALMDYINLCIEEWIRRGYVNNMNKYNISYPVLYPWWASNITFINSCITALLRKEKIRNEKKWYWDMNEFATIYQTHWYNTGYFWTSKLSIGYRSDVFHNKFINENINDYKYCCEQMNDYDTNGMITVRMEL